MFTSLLLAATLATGARLEPAGRIIDAGNLPLSMTLSPEGDRVILVLSGFEKPGVEVVDLAAGKVVQQIPLNSAFIGAAFSPDGKTLYVSGGFDDVVHVYSWTDEQATFSRDIDLKRGEKKGASFPAGIATSRDGKFLYVAENVADDVAIIDASSFDVVTRVKTDHYPYAIVAGDDGSAYVSAWGANSVSVIRDNAEVARVEVGRHPSALRLNRGLLYVALASVDAIAIVDTKTRKKIATIDDRAPGTREGTTPNALAFSPDGSRLYVAEADNNAVAVFDVATRKPLGRIPTGWYPADVIASADRLLILDSKGRGSTPARDAMQPGRRDDATYVLSRIKGAVDVVDLPLRDLPSLTKRVAQANHWRDVSRKPKYPPFEHVVYIIKENRTYDQLFGDVKEGDGDPSLLFFGRDISPNHHALADRFGLFDRFFTSGEVSQQGHYWSTASYVTDYTEKTTHPLYIHKRDDVDEGDVDEPAEGYLWTRTASAKLKQRVYGEFGDPTWTKDGYGPTKPSVRPFFDPDYPPFDMAIMDQRRVDVWLKKFAADVETNAFPSLEILHLPSDHTWGARSGKPTPRVYMADNDLALARIVSAISKSRYWRDTVIFVVEDDAQDGPDHVDSHRSVMLAISAYSRRGLHHRFTNTTDVVATIEQILGLAPMSQFDKYGRPLADVFASTPDLTPYEPLMPSVPWSEVNPPRTPAATKSELLDFSAPDVADEDTLNRIIWSAVKGEDAAYPGTQRGSTLMWLFGSR